MMCDEVNYMMLAQDNKVPEYYVPLDGVEIDYDELTNACNVTQPFAMQTFDNCDCSDPYSYDFYDEGRFKMKRFH